MTYGLIEYAFLSKAPNFSNEHTEQFDFFKYEDKLISQYQLILKDAENGCKVRMYEYTCDLQAFEKKVCRHCKSDLIYIKSSDFWGCCNYKSGGKHSTFSGLIPQIVNRGGFIKSTWLTDIIKECGLSGKLKAKQLYTFLLRNGFEDLREKFGYGSSLKHIDNFITAKQNSLIQEGLAFDYLKSKFDRVTPQQCITYKLEGEKETFCIPDFICSNRNEVLVVDAKLGAVDNKKMALYTGCLLDIMCVNGDNRELDGAFIVYKTNQFIGHSEFPIIRI